MKFAIDWAPNELSTTIISGDNGHQRLYIFTKKEATILRFSGAIEVEKGCEKVFYNEHFLERTALTIFLQLGSKLDIDNGKKVTSPDFWEKIWFSR